MPSVQSLCFHVLMGLGIVWALLWLIAWKHIFPLFFHVILEGFSQSKKTIIQLQSYSPVSHWIFLFAHTFWVIVCAQVSTHLAKLDFKVDPGSLFHNKWSMQSLTCH